jgi:hypothetical protein
MRPFKDLYITLKDMTNELDCVLSFNYQHINKLKTRRMTENVNLNEGYKGITICTPMEVLN